MRLSKKFRKIYYDNLYQILEEKSGVFEISKDFLDVQRFLERF